MNRERTERLAASLTAKDTALLPHLLQDLCQLGASPKAVAQRHPEQAQMFRDYVQSQADKTWDVCHNCKSAVWLLRAR